MPVGENPGMQPCTNWCPMFARHPKCRIWSTCVRALDPQWWLSFWCPCKNTTENGYPQEKPATLHHLYKYCLTSWTNTVVVASIQNSSPWTWQLDRLYRLTRLHMLPPPAGCCWVERLPPNAWLNLSLSAEGGPYVEALPCKREGPLLGCFHNFRHVKVGNWGGCPLTYHSGGEVDCGKKSTGPAVLRIGLEFSKETWGFGWTSPGFQPGVKSPKTTRTTTKPGWGHVSTANTGRSVWNLTKQGRWLAMMRKMLGARGHGVSLNLCVAFFWRNWLPSSTRV